MELAKPLGSAIRELVTIVHHLTLAPWIKSDPGEAGAQKAPVAKLRRPRIVTDVRQLVIRIARENGWGYSRILGELKKLGMGKVSRSTVVNILKAEGLDPGPKRGAGSWTDFIESDAATMWGRGLLT